MLIEYRKKGAFYYYPPMQYTSKNSKYEYPCACCGMRVGNPAQKVIRTAGKGIKVFTAQIGRERNTDKLVITHVKTKNGIITVAVKP